MKDARKKLKLKLMPFSIFFSVGLQFLLQKQERNNKQQTHQKMNKNDGRYRKGREVLMICVL